MEKFGEVRRSSQKFAEVRRSSQKFAEVREKPSDIYWGEVWVAEPRQNPKM